MAATAPTGLDDAIAATIQCSATGLRTVDSAAYVKLVMWQRSRRVWFAGGRLTDRTIGSGAAVGWASFQAPAYRSPAAGPVPVLTSMRRLFERSKKCSRAVVASVQLHLLNIRFFSSSGTLLHR